MLRDRKQAGIKLGDKLRDEREFLEDTVVIALPRGGVPVAFEVSQKLRLPLDIFTVKKIGSPYNPELAMGAVTEEGDVFFNEKILRGYFLDESELNRLRDEAVQKAKKQSQQLRGMKETINLKHKNIILVDDGIATGATVKVAIELLRQHEVRRISLAVPVCPEQSYNELKKLVDDFYVLETPHYFRAVGLHYEEFPQVSNLEVISLLNKSFVFDLKKKVNEDMIMRPL